MRARWVVLGSLFLVGAAQSAPCQREARIEVSVSSVSGRGVYLDRGRNAGLAVGDRVLFVVPGAAHAEGIVRAVSRSSSRVEMLPGSPLPGIGARAEISVPPERLQPPTQPTSGTPLAPPGSVPVAPRAPTPAGEPAPSPLPEKPQWTHPPETWNDEMPLLADAARVEPEDRESRWSGRVYARWNATVDGRGDGRTYQLGTLGFDGALENPFGRGGALEIDAQLFHRAVDLSDAGDDADTRPLLRRFSYWFGGTEEEPSRWQFGRFLGHEFPELGVVDGVEWTQRYGNGASRFGFSAGGLPEPFPSMDSFESVGVSVYHRYVPDDDERLALGTAYQSTWWRGEQDRNLFVGTVDWEATRDLALDAAAWVDLYGSGDEVKDGLELTELRASATQRLGDASGAGLSYSHVRWPELLRREFDEVSAERLEENVVDRWSLTGWHGFSTHVRANARADTWSDQDDSGTNAELGVALRDVLWKRGEIGASVFRADGSYSSGPGLRLSASKAFERVAAHGSYEFADYEQKDFFGDQASLAQHSLFGGLDFEIGASWDLSLTGDLRWGDEVEGYGVGFLLQTRF